MKRTYRKSRKVEKIKEFRVNEQIRVPKVRFIDESFNDVISIEDALERAQKAEMDLVEVSPNAHPPVVKLMDYGRFQYQREKLKRKQKASQRKVDIKGIRLSARISDHDKDVRMKQARKFLDKGDKVKIELILKGREFQHIDVAKQIINEFIQALGEDIVIEQKVEKLGNRLNAVVAKKQ